MSVNQFQALCLFLCLKNSVDKERSPNLTQDSMYHMKAALEIAFLEGMHIVKQDIFPV